ncbi:hypothetical protein BZG36_02806 [Bifiguratus adelaidae]|uniref:Nucleolar 27S pre-rRNA processing Urb2/Npa2 C-terminal domain-containing protein n=1 Tax=Bifiguratus adelaidae TaxID=1938954 RepID=A0A261Y1K1_9FUNG|nr:hypothetical protein BZG36_02806 [Bifiguratus adelaidae]
MGEVHSGRVVFPTTSEGIAKALKGGGLSHADKIQIALQAWHDNHHAQTTDIREPATKKRKVVFFPLKEEFLFGWVTASLTKPVSQKEQSQNDLPVLTLNYWRLLQDLLDYFHTISSTTLVIRSPLILAYIHLVNNIAKSVNIEGADAALQLSQQQVDLLEVATTCYQLVKAGDYTQTTRATIEQYSAMVTILLRLWSHLFSHGDRETRTARVLINFVGEILDDWQAMITAAANPRKTFSLISSPNVLLPLLVFYDKHAEQGQDSSTSLHAKVENIIGFGLYHPDFILDYTSLFQYIPSDASYNMMTVLLQNQSFQRGLFATLASLLTDGQTDDNEAKKSKQGKPTQTTRKASDAEKQSVLRCIPKLYQLFLSAYRQRRRQPHGTTTVLRPLSMTESYRYVEFGMFLEFWKLIDGDFDLMSAQQHLARNAMTLPMLLYCLLDQGVHQLTNDAVSKLMATFFNQVAHACVEQLQPKSLEKRQALAYFQILNTLLRLDHDVVRGHLDRIWPALFNASFDGEATADLLLTMLDIFGRSRQLAIYIDGLTSHIMKMSNTSSVAIMNQLESSLFATRILDKFEHCVQDLPAAQVLPLCKSMTETFTGVMQNATATTSLQATLLSVYVCRFLQSMQLGPLHRKEIQRQLGTLQATGLKVLLQAKELNDTNSAWLASAMHVLYVVNQRTPFRPAGQDKLSLEKILLDARSRDQWRKRNAQLDLLLTAISMQYGYELDETATETKKAMVAAALTHLDGSRDYSTSWDGLLHHVDASRFQVALWKLLADDWLAFILPHSSEAHIHLICNIIVQSLSLWCHVDTYVTSYYGIALKLLRTADTYEFSGWRGQLVDHALDHLGGMVRMLGRLSEQSELFEPKDLYQALQTTDAFKDIVASQTYKPKADPTVGLSSLASFIKFFHIIPLEFYTRHQRNQALALVYAFDYCAWPVDGLDVRLLCRSLIAKLLVQRADGGFLESNPSLLTAFLACLPNDSAPSVHVSLDIMATVLKRALSALSTRNSASQLVSELSTWAMHNLKTSLEADNVQTVSIPCLILTTILNCIKTGIPEQEKGTLSLTSLQILSEIPSVTKRLEEKFEGVVSKLPSAKLLDSSLLQSFDAMITCGQSLILFNRQMGTDTSVNTKTERIIFDVLARVLSHFKREQYQADSDLLQAAARMLGTLWSMAAQSTQAGSVSYDRILATHWVFHRYFIQSGRDQVILGSVVEKVVPALPIDDIEACFKSVLDFAANTAHTDTDRSIGLWLLSFIITKSTEDQKRKLRTHVSKVCMFIAESTLQTASTHVLQLAFDLAAAMCAVRAWRLRASEISHMLGAICNISAAPTRLDASATQVSDNIFNAIYRLLFNISNYHRAILLECLPLFVSILQRLFHCFKSIHPNLAQTKAKNTKTKNTHAHVEVFFALFDVPLSVPCAHHFARLLVSLSQKPISAYTNDATTAHLIATSSFKAFSKHALYLLAEYFSIQIHPIATISQPDLKAALQPGLYALLDLCGEHEREALMANLDSAGKVLFRNLYSDYLKHHKYTGR